MVAAQVAEQGMQNHHTWNTKVIQLYETYLVRHGIMLTGPAAGGKSTILDILARSLSMFFIN